MCGIAGYSGSFDPSVLTEANRAQAHRGPDAQGVWCDRGSGIGLAHRRLSILDLTSAGAQPMISDDGKVVLIYNGEIYNFAELKKELEGKGHRFRGHSDTEALLKLYLALGEEMLPRLNGIFAFALWDGRKRSLFVARDALGVKPFYYAQTTAGFAFASEIKALLPIIPGLRELDIPSLHRYLSFLWCPGEGTPLRGVRKLLPGEAMIIRDAKIVRQWVWYQLPPFRGITGGLSLSSSLTKTGDCLRQAVHRQMVADVPVGAFLSGGLDSSAVVAFAREKNPGIRCFTIGSAGGQEDGMADDLPYAKKVARHLQVPLEVVTIDPKRMARDIEHMVMKLDEPLADPACLNVLYISQLAREKGIKVLLSGAGGDDLFTGYRRHMAVYYERYWDWLPKPMRSGLSTMTQGFNQRRPFYRRLAKLFNGADLDSDERIVNYFLWSKESQLSLLYTPEFRDRLGVQRAGSPLLNFLGSLPGKLSPLERMLVLEQRFFLGDHNLNYTDKMSMAAGVEVRVPFLDLDLLEHAARVPIGLKQKGSCGKWILKKAMEPYLPKDIIYRPKSGFGAPLRRWMRHELKGLIEDTLSVERLRRRGLFDTMAVRNLIAQNDSGQVDGAYLLLSLMSIEIWCRVYIDSGLFHSPGGRG